MSTRFELLQVAVHGRWRCQAHAGADLAHGGWIAMALHVILDEDEDLGLSARRCISHSVQLHGR
jgi:hypothetical protein